MKDEFEITFVFDQELIVLLNESKEGKPTPAVKAAAKKKIKGEAPLTVKRLKSGREAEAGTKKTAEAVKAKKKTVSTERTEQKKVAATAKGAVSTKTEQAAKAAAGTKTVRAVRTAEKIKRDVKKLEPEFSGAGILGGDMPEACETGTAIEIESAGNIKEQVSIISLNWSLLSPADSIPVLEKGEPVEISRNSMVRIYFQKPNVRQVVWRFRKNPEVKNSMPIIRLYRDGDMLWYEALDDLYGSKYIIFPEGSELSRTWAEIGYLTETGEFIFIARTPAWPPSCLFKKLPRFKTERKMPKSATALIGATEGIPGGRHLPVTVNITSSGAGFTVSGAGIGRK